MKKAFPADTVRQSEISTRDPGEVEEFIRSLYVGNRTRFDVMPERARFSAIATTASTLSAAHVCTTVGCSTLCDPLDRFIFFAVAVGAIRVRTADSEMVVQAGEYSFYPVGVEVEIELFDADVRTLRLPISRMEEAAVELAGGAGANLRMLGADPVSPAMGRHWSAVTRLAHTTAISDPEALRYPLLAEEMARQVALTALHVFPNTAARADTSGVQDASGTTALRRAVAYIDAHAGEALTLVDIAEAAGTSSRALERSFARHLDTSPMEYVRRSRLDAAHRELQNADPVGGLTVQEVARRWGFEPSLFSRRYRDAFGRAPGETLQGRSHQ